MMYFIVVGIGMGLRQCILGRVRTNDHMSPTSSAIGTIGTDICWGLLRHTINQSDNFPGRRIKNYCSIAGVECCQSVVYRLIGRKVTTPLIERLELDKSIVGVIEVLSIVLMESFHIDQKQAPEEWLSCPPVTHQLIQLVTGFFGGKAVVQVEFPEVSIDFAVDRHQLLKLGFRPDVWDTDFVSKIEIDATDATKTIQMVNPVILFFVLSCSLLPIWYGQRQ